MYLSLANSIYFMGIQRTISCIVKSILLPHSGDIIRKTKRRTEINRSGPKLKRNVTHRKTKRTSGYAFFNRPPPPYFRSKIDPASPGSGLTPGASLSIIPTIFKRPPNIVRRPFFLGCRFALWVAARPLFRFPLTRPRPTF